MSSPIDSLDMTDVILKKEDEKAQCRVLRGKKKETEKAQHSYVLCQRKEIASYVLYI